MKWWRWTLLILELVLLAVILVLPQVDGPDFAFTAGTAPSAACARPHSLPSQPAIAAVMAPLRVRPAMAIPVQASEIPIIPGSVSRLALLCSLIC